MMLYTLLVLVAVVAIGEGLGDGGWSAWGDWSACTATCDPGIAVRNRMCNQPTPGPNGLYCPGDCNDVKVCGDQPNQRCPIRGGWSRWKDWSTCSVMCGGGIQTRWRNCDDPVPQANAEYCRGRGQETIKCNEQQCSTLDIGRTEILGGWTGWSEYGKCTVTCGAGLQMRSRSCVNPEPGPAGRQCVGDGVEGKPCNDQDCPASADDGGWSVWMPWTGCTASCGGGFKLRERQCDNPEPKPTSRDCVGELLQKGNCNTQSCPKAGKDFVAFSVSLGQMQFRAPNRDSYKQIPLNEVIYNNGGHFNFKDHCFHAPYRGIYWFGYSSSSYIGCRADVHLYTTKPGKTKVHRAGGQHWPDPDEGKEKGQVGVTVILEMDSRETACLWLFYGTLWIGHRDVTQQATLFSGMLLQKL